MSKLFAGPDRQGNVQGEGSFGVSTADGNGPIGNVMMDSTGNLFGTTQAGGYCFLPLWLRTLMLRMAEIGRSGERYILSGSFVELDDIFANLASLNQQLSATVQ